MKKRVAAHDDLKSFLHSADIEDLERLRTRFDEACQLRLSEMPRYSHLMGAVKFKMRELVRCHGKITVRGRSLKHLNFICRG